MNPITLTPFEKAVLLLLVHILKRLCWEHGETLPHERETINETMKMLEGGWS